MERITDNIYVETQFAGCNVGFVTTEEGIVMIDTPMRPTDAISWRDEIAKKGEVSYIINTEHHLDHVLGNFFFSGKVISQQESMEKFTDSLGSMEQVTEMIKVMDPAGVSLMEGYKPRLPSITFSNKLNLFMGKHTFELINLPGHTPNEIVVYIPQERVIFASDNMFYNHQPFLHECLPFQWLETLEKMEKMDIDYIVPGHGEVCTKAAIGILSSYIKEVIDEIKKAIDQGLSQEEAADKVSISGKFPMPPYLQQIGAPMLRMSVMRVYEQLRQHQS